MDDNALEQLMRRYGLYETAEILADLIHDNPPGRSLTTLCIRLAMAYGVRAAQVRTVEDERQAQLETWMKDRRNGFLWSRGEDLTK